MGLPHTQTHGKSGRGRVTSEPNYHPGPRVSSTCQPTSLHCTPSPPPGPNTHARLLHFPEMLAQWELQEAVSNKSRLFHSDQRTFQRKPQPARRGLGRTSMLTAPAKGNILGLSKHSNWKQGPGIPHDICSKAVFFGALNNMDKQRTVLRTIPTFPSAAMEIWVLRPAHSDCLLPLNHPSTPTTQRPSCDQPPLIPRSQKQNTPYHRRQQTAPTVHTRAWVAMVWHLIPCY